MSEPVFHPDDHERIVEEIGRELDSIAADSTIPAPLGFSDRVMLAVAQEPLPQPARAFGTALLAGQVRAAAAAVGDAWRVVIGGSTPLSVRGQALALVLLVAIGSLAVAGGAAVGAMDLLAQDPPAPLPAPTTLFPSPAAPTAMPSLSPDPNPNPGPPQGIVDPSPTAANPGSTATPRATARTRTPSPTATGTDDHGGSDSGKGGSGSGSGPGATETPSPTATPSDDHGGGDG
jgi:hypothetical protein